jgi:hypothetical protein
MAVTLPGLYVRGNGLHDVDDGIEQQVRSDETATEIDPRGEPDKSAHNSPDQTPITLVRKTARGVRTSRPRPMSRLTNVRKRSLSCSSY